MARPRVHAQLLRDLAARIVGGEWKPGDILPNEAELCATHGISRGALREAVRVLAAKGLVESRSRTGTQVRARESWNLLDPDVLAWSLAGPLDPHFARSLAEARVIIEPGAARRASAAQLARIEAAYEGMARSLPDDVEACTAADVAFHAGVLEASGNVVLGSLTATISAALTSLFRLSTSIMRSQERTLGAHRQVLECIRMRDAEGARAAMLRLLDVSADDLVPFLGGEKGESGT